MPRLKQTVALARMVIAGMLGAALAAAVPPAQRLGGWVPYWAFPAGLASVRAAQDRLTDVFLFVLRLDGDGAPVLACGEPALAGVCGNLRMLGKRIWLTEVNDRAESGGRITLKDPDAVHALFASASLRKAHIASLVELCRVYDCQGVDLDFENLNLADRTGFSQFAAELGVALHEHNLLLSVTLEGKTGETASGTGRGADWQQLGQAADRLQIMLYNLHYGGSAPGPVATPSWIDQVLAFAQTRCAKAKLVPALKVSGFEWGPKPRGISFRELEARRLQDHAEFRREPEGETPYLAYTQAGVDHVSYCDDARSLDYKLKFLQGRGYSNTTLWSLGTEDPGLWPAPELPAPEPTAAP